ncbi:MAG: acyl-CoA dehydrogenase [Acidobacteriia bacterium]|nr:acyl-CoA dehydrogenase [Terriglobia bacterium]
MDFTLSTEQAILRDTVRRYCQERYRFQDRLALLRSREGFSREHWKTCAELGWIGAALPEDVGGFGGSAIELALILEEFGRVLVLEPFLSCAVLAAQTLNLAGLEKQRKQWLPAVIKGESILALAHFEQEARGDLRFVEARAAPVANGGYVLSGKKSMVIGGGNADQLIVSARTEGASHDAHGISLFVVSPGLPGIVRRSYRTVDGGNASEVEFDGLKVDKTAVLGVPGEAVTALEHAVDFALVGVCAEAVGAMDSVVSVTRDYLRTRRAYGTTLSTLQALQHRLADMLVELELARSTLYRALAALASPDRWARRKAVSAAKALIGRAGRYVGSYGIQLHGGIGMSDEYIVGHLFKRLTVIESVFGNSDFHLNQMMEASEISAAATPEPTAQLAHAAMASP